MNKTDLFIQKAKKIHGDLYDYSRTIYNRANEKVIIICKTHGEFLVSPHSHLKGSKCKLCVYNKFKKNKTEKLKTNKIELFVNRAHKIHNNKYDYSKAIYINSKTKVEIICKDHGSFWMTPNNHLHKHGCKKCSKYIQTNPDDFKNKASRIHPNLNFDKSIYINNKTQIIVTCPFHGDYITTPRTIISGHGCRQCANNKQANDLKLFIEKAKQLYHDKYEYDKSIYINNKTPIIITCKDHGDWTTSPDSFLDGHGCKKCYLSNKVINTESFISASREVHGNNFNYDETCYLNSFTKLKVKCNKCQKTSYKLPSVHLNSGCGYCNLSNEINLISSWLSGEEIIYNTRDIINPYEIDIYLPRYKFGIEYHGLYWHSYNSRETKDEKYYHNYKAIAAQNANIRLFQIFEHELLYKPNLLKSMIYNQIGKSKKIFARDCELSYATDKDAVSFYINHIQGYRNATYHICLKYNNEIMSMMSLLKKSDSEWEIMRIATRMEHIVIGGVSKLFKKFIKDHNPRTIITFADLRFSVGNIYHKLGFKLLYISEPNYFYYKGNQILSRQKCQKYKLNKLLPNFDIKLSESENMFNNGYRRVWDAGHIKFILN